MLLRFCFILCDTGFLRFFSAYYLYVLFFVYLDDLYFMHFYDFYFEVTFIFYFEVAFILKFYFFYGWFTLRSLTTYVA